MYYLARTLFNTLRSIEPLVMVIWVGIGPFAGSLALALHTAASLAKLYFEQVEGISAGHIKAIRAAGATRTQASFNTRMRLPRCWQSRLLSPRWTTSVLAFANDTCSSS